MRRINEMEKEDVLKVIELVFDESKKAVAAVGKLGELKL